LVVVEEVRVVVGEAEERGGGAGRQEVVIPKRWRLKADRELEAAVDAVSTAGPPFPFCQHIAFTPTPPPQPPPPPPCDIS